MIRAAGIMILAQSRVLLLKRGPGGDYPGMWCFPGGHLEHGETLEQCAVRETLEETGFDAAGLRFRPHTHRITEGAQVPAMMPVEGVEVALPPDAPSTPAPDAVDFTTFMLRIEDQFVPAPDSEHVGFAWAPLDEPPEPLHPGCRIALERVGMDELGVARAMAVGDLTSPQRYENVWLFAIRITGTGVAYRQALEEYVWRDPALYMNEDFRQRCNGLAVIWEHPKKSLLNAKEFADRAIGSVLLPYLKPEANEVWGIAKIYDAEAAKEMAERPMSTSPAVNFSVPGTNSKIKLEDGSVILIEGKPSLLDHIAICSNGVWDKGGDPAGVDNGATAMADAMTTPTRRSDPLHLLAPYVAAFHLNVTSRLAARTNPH